MRAAVFRGGEIVVDSIDDVAPGRGHVLVRTLSCGICGSDLHALHNAPKLVDSSRRAGAPFVMDLSRDIVFGHEFCAEVIDYGPQTKRTVKPGSNVCSVPVNFAGGVQQTIGYSADTPGGFAEYMVLSEGLLVEVPNGLPHSLACMTEPMAVGWHAVGKAVLGEDDVPMVIGCGPVGLAVIASLKKKGIRPIIASDYSPRRRELAELMGADIVVDPIEGSPFLKLDDANLKTRPIVVFECVGAVGMLQQIFTQAPRQSRIIVVGVCLDADQFEPFFGIAKELSIQFVMGYTTKEFATVLSLIGEGLIDVRPLVTGTVSLGGVAAAFRDLKAPEQHAKIVVEPWR